MQSTSSVSENKLKIKIDDDKSKKGGFILEENGDMGTMKSVRLNMEGAADAQGKPGGKKEVYKIIVDPENGPIKTLEEAILQAREGTLIKLCEGAYTCKVKITTPGIKIEPRDKDKSVFLIGNEGPAIKVELKDKQFLVIKKVLLAHSGISLGQKVIQ